MRLAKELDELSKTTPHGVIVTADSKNNKLWECFLPGPKGSFYEGGSFRLSITFPDAYPFKAPKIKFETKIYHPNVNKENGEICQDIYEKDWSPVKTIKIVLDLLVSMLSAPNLESPVEAEIAKVYADDKTKFAATVKEYISKYAKA